MITTRIIAITILFVLTLPLSALAMEEIPVAEAIQEADRELSGDSSYQSASSVKKKLLRNAAIRGQVVIKTQAQLDEMQKKLDREFDVRLGKAYYADSGYGIDPAIKTALMRRFKAEMFLFMAENRASIVKLAYGNAEGDSGDIQAYMKQTFSNRRTSFANEIGKILNKISADLEEEGYKVNGNWISEIEGNIIRAFNMGSMGVLLGFP